MVWLMLRMVLPMATRTFLRVSSRSLSLHPRRLFERHFDLGKFVEVIFLIRRVQVGRKEGRPSLCRVVKLVCTLQKNPAAVSSPPRW